MSPRVILLAAGFAMAVAAPAARNLLPNPGFEQVDETTGYPARWTPVWSRPTKCAYSLTRARRGDARALVNNESEKASEGLRSERVRVEPGRRYRAEVFVWLAPGAKGGVALYLEFWDAAGVRLLYRTNGTKSPGQWRRLRVTLTAPPTAAHATALIYSGSTATGRAWFDDASLVELPR